MNTRFVLAFLAVACLATSVSALHAHGVHSVGTFNGIHCTDVSFGVDFGSVPNVVVSMDHRTKPAQHDAVSHWVTSVTATGFRACVTETGHYDQAHDGHLHYNWLAYTNELLAIDAPITVYAPGSRQCSYVNFGTTFSTDVNVHATLSHGSETTGASIWIENIFADKVEVCAEGTKDHPYTGAATAFLAIYEDASSLAIGDSHHGQVRFPSWTQSSTKCVDVALDLDFVPTYGLVTINHRSYTGTAVHHATTVWLEELSSSKITICIGELEQYDSSHDDNLHVLYTIGGRDELDIGTCPTVVVAKPPPGQKITESSPGNCICLEFDCDE